ncbi:NADH-quinone oxidoreductase subunit N [Orchesella cincta]|uniref:NADH-quinone oxidoreductase subunit N n=1 Tax=Orchesella cincta TaxID=48709 RepID=A0A1D2M742_ORCCI|nr:NADH-quinone oxidoreductase subunit N [Orchesella cincta]
MEVVLDRDGGWYYGSLVCNVYKEWITQTQVVLWRTKMAMSCPAGDNNAFFVGFRAVGNFSTAGLLQTAKTMVGVDMDDRTDDDETLDRRRSAGNVINSLLLLSSMLEVLLSFSTFGMAISVLCKSSYKASRLSSTGSSGSENQASEK